MKTGERDTIAAHLKKAGVSRRSFLQLCSTLLVTAPVGLSLTGKATAAQIAKIVGKARRPSVIWLHFQDCTGCTETLLRTSAPDVAHLILDVISLDYHETLMAASGAQAEAALRSAIADNAGKYVLVVEGAIPTRDDGVYMQLGGRPAIQVIKEVAGRAAAFGDEGHRKGYCLYKLGCKGPVTHAACATRHFNEIPGVWPIGTGVPCMGCTEKGVIWQMGTFETVPIHLATPPDTYPPIFSTAGQLKVGAAGLVGAIAGAVGGATWVASQRFHSSMEAGVTRIAADRAHAEKAKLPSEKPAGKKED
jgi:Ni,Fe-hydrogenase I small subunit